MNKMLKCNCGKTTEIEQSGAIHTIGKMQQMTGWFYIFNRVGNGIWACPDCHAKAVMLAEELIKLIGSDQVILWCIMGKSKEN